MNRNYSKLWFFSTPLIFSFALLACGGDVELAPEIQAHLDEYEDLIDSYQPKFAAVRGKRPEFAKVADSYSKEAKAWMGKWGTVAPTLSDEEGRAVKAKIDKLNKRAVRMLTSG